MEIYCIRGLFFIAPNYSVYGSESSIRFEKEEQQ